MTLEDEPLTVVTRRLNDAGISAFPVPPLSLFSVYVDDVYENYDYDVVPPGRRREISAQLELSGWKPVTSRHFRHRKLDHEIEFPRPAATLGQDPSDRLAAMLDRPGRTLVATPTQALLLIFHRFAGELAVDETTGQPRSRYWFDLIQHLVYEQPANLGKVRDWVGAAGHLEVFVPLKTALWESQAIGVDLRRRKQFLSRL